MEEKILQVKKLNTKLSINNEIALKNTQNEVLYTNNEPANKLKFLKEKLGIFDIKYGSYEKYKVSYNNFRKGTSIHQFLFLKK